MQEKSEQIVRKVMRNERKTFHAENLETAELLQVQKFVDKHSYYAESTKYKLCL